MPLFVISTPIGNLGDLSPRAREALAGAAVVAAEDTRVTRKLFAALGLPTPPLVSYRSHGEARRAEPLADRVEAGEDVALVSDAGAPGVSDPGQHLVRACHLRGLSVRSLPGPSALATALSVSGLPGLPSTFLGFSPRKGGALRRWLADASRLPGSFVYFEAPSRAAASAAAVAATLPDREICLCRELSKLHEEILLLPASEMAENLAARERVRGELAFVVGPGRPVEEDVTPPERMSAIAGALAARWGVDRQAVYRGLVALKDTLEGE